MYCALNKSFLLVNGLVKATVKRVHSPQKMPSYDHYSMVSPKESLCIAFLRGGEC